MKYFAIIFLLLPGAALGQYHFTLQGKTTDFFNHVTLYLTIIDSYSNQKYKSTDSVVVEHNTFLFKGELNKPCEMAYLSYKADHQSYNKNFVLDTGKTDVIIPPVPADYIYYKNQLALLRINNSSSNALLNRLDSIYMASMKLYGYYTDSTKQYKILPNNATRRCEDQKRQMLAHYDSFFSLIYLYQLYHTHQKPDSILYTLQQLKNNVRYSDLGRELLKELSGVITRHDALTENHPMPGIRVKNYTGRIFDTGTLKGQPYVVVFCATWCGPCRENLPFVVKLYNKYKSKGLKVVYFNLDDNRGKWSKEIKDYKLKWINVSDGVKWVQSTIAKNFNILGIPVYILVDRKNKIVFNSNNYSEPPIPLLTNHLVNLFTK
jgi:thiol-disulfide isomerase/thioredoxin